MFPAFSLLGFLLFHQGPAAGELGDLQANLLQKKARIAALAFKKNALAIDPESHLKALQKQEDKSTAQKARENIIQALLDKKIAPAEDLPGLPKNMEEALLPFRDKLGEFYAFREAIPAAEKQGHFSFNNNLAYIPPSHTAAFVLLIMALVLVGTGLLIHRCAVGFRSWIRRRWNAEFIGWRWLGLSILPALFSLSCAAQHSWEPYSPQEVFSKEKQSLEEGLKKTALTLADWQTTVSAQESASPLATFMHKEDFARLELALAADLAAKGIQATDKDLISSKAMLDKLIQEAAGMKTTASKSERIAGYSLGGILALFGFSMAFAKRRQKKHLEVCPRCFKNTLKHDPTSKKVLCSSKMCASINLNLTIKDCHFPRVTLPVAGIPGSGKTHWLALLYRLFMSGQNSRRNYFSMNSIPNPDWERILKDINNQGSPGATQENAFRNIYFKVSDNQGLSELLLLPSLLRSSGLTICFDYAGEIFNFNKTQHEDIREMLAESNGLIFFFDPTQVIRGAEDLSSPTKGNKVQGNTESQIHAFNTTCDNFGYKAGGGKASPKLKIPLAVCISKFDLVSKQGPMKGD
ncbi:MAG: hypothetical protein EXR99_16980, partial [Gemmataceae bacterium]|nr:hypothetical protein [Gemmataceae bacterium]